MARQKPFRPQSGGPRRPAGASSRPGRPKGLGTGRPKPASFVRKPAGPSRKAAGSIRSKPRDDGSNQDSDRLQKVLAHAGVDSRRACEELILKGRVTVDGKTVRELGTRVDAETARIEVDGQRVKIEKHVYYAVNKPKGYVSTNDDPSGRPRVVDLLPEIPQRVYTVGRLDEDSTGLILLTNDGELANKLAHPRFGVEKLYRALVAGLPTPEVLNRVTDGVWLADGKVRAKRVKIVGRQGEATTLELVLAEGKNREVRRIFAKMGHKVMSLTRIAVGPIPLKGLPLGEFRTLSKDEVESLQKVAAGIEVRPSRPQDRRPPAKNKPAGPPRAKPDSHKPDTPAQAAKVLGPPVAKVPAPAAGSRAVKPGKIKIEPNMILSSGAVVGAKPGTGSRPTPSKPRPDSRSGTSGGDRRPPASGDRRQPPAHSRDRRPAGPSAPKVLGPKPENRPPGRRIIGLDASVLPAHEKRGRGATGAGSNSGPEHPEKPKQKRPPRAAHGVKRKPRDKDHG